jgi:hypothetical protein
MGFPVFSRIRSGQEDFQFLPARQSINVRKEWTLPRSLRNCRMVIARRPDGSV